MLWRSKLHITLSVGMGVISSVLGVSATIAMLQQKAYLLEWGLWGGSGGEVVMSLIIDFVSLLFFSFVLFISASVLYYSGEYMYGEVHYNRFMLTVLLFVVSMGFLIFSPNLVSLLLGWDGLGIVSYALVIYYQNEKSAGAGMLTAVSNRVGDGAILVGIGLMYTMGCFSFIPYLQGSHSLPAYVGGFIMLAAMTKSAQVPFSAWLPAAMAAPTPVSALVHSSTLVTAGVYLLFRVSAGLGETVSIFLLMVGTLTMFIAGLGANLETDLKKVIALSTLSQLGLMVSSVGAGLPELALFHLLAHALFKALLFMGAGGVIHSVGGSQDIRQMGGLVTAMPLTAGLMSVANLALCGFPFLTGFYSKDLVIESLFLGWVGPMLFILFCVATGLTVSYSLRLSWFMLLGSVGVAPLTALGESGGQMTRAMLGLGVGAVCGGSLLGWMILPNPTCIWLVGVEKWLVVLVCVGGGALGWGVSTSHPTVVGTVVSWLGGGWFMPVISTTVSGGGGLLMGRQVWYELDKGWWELGGGQGVWSLLGGLSSKTEVLLANLVKTILVLGFMWVPLAVCLGV